MFSGAISMPARRNTLGHTVPANTKWTIAWFWHGWSISFWDYWDIAFAIRFYCIFFGNILVSKLPGVDKTIKGSAKTFFCAGCRRRKAWSRERPDQAIGAAACYPYRPLCPHPRPVQPSPRLQRAGRLLHIQAGPGAWPGHLDTESRPLEPAQKIARYRYLWRKSVMSSSWKNSQK